MHEEQVLEVLSREPTRAWTLDEVLAALPAIEAKSVRRALKRLSRTGELERSEGRRYRRPEATSAPAPSGPLLGNFRRVGKAVYVEPFEDPGPFARKEPALLDPAAVPEELADGSLVQYEILSPWSPTSAALARLVEVLGKPGERGVEMKRILLEHNLETPFPDAVLEEATAFGDAPRASEIAGRRDLRGLALVTIDGEDAKDFDDAVCAERLGEDAFTVYVAIADVSHYVRQDHPLDLEALRRGTSTYLTDRCIPMLPEQLSNHLCSLRPHEDRLCLVAEMVIDRDGHTRESKFYRAVMRSRARLTYEQVATALEGEPDSICAPLLPSLLRLSKVATALLARRLRRGAIDLDVPEAKIVFDGEGLPVDATRRPRNDAHRLIEDLMLAANEAVASFTASRRIPTLYRVHEDPDPKKLAQFVALLERLGVTVKLKKKIRPRDVAHMVEDLHDLEGARELQGMVLRTMAQARYDAQNLGHFGLAAEHYLHFTSPIRRYPDLMVHRLLMRALDGEELRYRREELAAVAMQNSASERKAMEAERATLSLDRTYVASAFVGQHLEGTISGVARFGLFVALDKPFVDGLVPIATLGMDYFEPDDVGFSLRGKMSGAVFHLGQRVTVEIIAVNLQRRQVEMRVVSEPQGGKPEPDQGRRRGRRRGEKSAPHAKPQKPVAGGRPEKPPKRPKRRRGG